MAEKNQDMRIMTQDMQDALLEKQCVERYKKLDGEGKESMETTMTWYTTSEYQLERTKRASASGIDPPQKTRWLGVTRLYITGLNLGYEQVSQFIVDSGESTGSKKKFEKKPVIVEITSVTFSMTEHRKELDGETIVGPATINETSVPVSFVVLSPQEIIQRGLVQDAGNAYVAIPVDMDGNEIGIPEGQEEKVGYFVGSGYASKTKAILVDATQVNESRTEWKEGGVKIGIEAGNSILALQKLKYVLDGKEWHREHVTDEWRIFETEEAFSKHGKFWASRDIWTWQNFLEWKEEGGFHSSTGILTIKDVATPIWGCIEIQVPKDALLGLSGQEQDNARVWYMNVNVQLTIRIPTADTTNPNMKKK